MRAEVIDLLLVEDNPGDVELEAVRQIKDFWFAIVKLPTGRIQP